MKIPVNYKFAHQHDLKQLDAILLGRLCLEMMTGERFPFKNDEIVFYNPYLFCAEINEGGLTNYAVYLDSIDKSLSFLVNAGLIYLVESERKVYVGFSDVVKKNWFCM